MSTTENIYEILDRVKALIEDAAEEEHLSELLMWILLRQQCDFQMLQLEETQGLLDD